MVEFGLDVSNNRVQEIEKPTVRSLLSAFESAISLDISKNSTGVCLWEGGDYRLFRIDIETPYNSKDPLSEARMRKEFRGYLETLTGGRKFEVGVVENVFGGENFETTRILLSLNTVLDEMILDRVCSIERYFKRENSAWKKWFRLLTNVGKGLNHKYEIQEIMRFLEFDFFLENEHLRPTDKLDIGFQDKLDATGLLCALSLELNSNIKTTTRRKVRLSDLKFGFVSDVEEFDYMDEDIFSEYPIKEVNLGRKDIGSQFKDIFSIQERNCIYYMLVPNERLGNFGVVRDFPYMDQGYLYVYAHWKNLGKS